jgi:hypothetical protein
MVASSPSRPLLPIREAATAWPGPRNLFGAPQPGSLIKKQSSDELPTGIASTMSASDNGIPDKQAVTTETEKLVSRMMEVKEISFLI